VIASAVTVLTSIPLTVRLLSVVEPGDGLGMGVTQQEKDEWRDCLLQEVVSFLAARKHDIHGNYMRGSAGQLPLEQLEAEGLLDVEVAITFLQDKRPGWGLGKGFLGMNLIQ